MDLLEQRESFQAIGAIVYEMEWTSGISEPEFKNNLNFKMQAAATNTPRT
jgi:hypothetical protein